MKEGKYYSCVSDFLKESKNHKTKQFLLVAEYTAFDYTVFENYPTLIAGAIVPFVVFDAEFFNKGLISYDLEEGEDFTIIKDIADFEIPKTFFQHSKSLIVLLDGLSSNITKYLEKVFENSQIDAQIIGGGAGKLTLEKDPVIFDNSGIYSNASLIVSINDNLIIAIDNGWEVLEGPFLATNTEKNILKKLNFSTAFDVYKEVVQRDCKREFTDDNFFDIAKSYPIGIIKYDNQLVVRDPIGVDDDGNIILVGDIPLNSTINILKGVEDNLINSTGKAMEKFCSTKLKQRPKSLILFDCLSRSIFLGDKLNEELKIIKEKVKYNGKLSGALTLGEISNNGNEYVTFYNKTCVVGVLC